MTLALLLSFAPAALAQTFRLSGFLTGEAVSANGPKSWLEGGWGRLDANRKGVIGDAQLGVDWVPTSWFDVHVHGDARRDIGHNHAGVVEAYAEVQHAFGSNQVRLRAGQFFLPTSRENRGRLWSSPYALTFSSVNSWIAHEVRPIGAELEWRHELPSLSAITVAGTAFRGNDTMGALLAWRGWAVSNRLTTYNEVLPLPSLFSLKDPRGFVGQREGTKPFGRDLDGRTGFAERVRFSVPERGMIQFAHVDNRADRELYRGQYAWATKFNLVSGELGNQESTVLAAEYMTGQTGMGFDPHPYVQADFHAWYALLSRKVGRGRITARVDEFSTKDRDVSLFTETNTEHGRSWALAWLYEVTKNIRLGAELTNVTGDKLIASQSGADANTDAHMLTLEVRYGF
jgi:hypothetical protein